MPRSEVSRYESLYQIASALHQQGLKIQDVLQTGLSMSCRAIDIAHGYLLTFDDDQHMHDAYLFGSDSDREIGRDLWNRLIHQGLIGYVQHGRRTVVIRNISTDPRWPSLPEPSVIPSKGSAVGLPLLFEGRLCGVMVLIHPHIDYFNVERMAFLEMAAELIAIAFQNAVQYDIARTREVNYRRMLEKTQQEKAEQARLEQLRRDLAAMTYHDMRSPLQGIQTGLAGLERVLSSSDDGPASQFIRLSVRSVRQVARMVKGLLDIERLENGRAILNKRATQLDALLNEAVDLVRPLAQESDQELLVQIDPDLPPLTIDSDMIARVVTNLIENAAKHTPSGGCITVIASVVPTGIQISVMDTGPGVPRHFKDEIFDKYFRIKYSNAPNGVGLGLAFCRLAVEAHGGRIWVDSASAGGAIFSFTLPVQVSAESVPVAAARR